MKADMSWTAIILFGALFIALIIVGPLITIWALNTLFASTGWVIEYTVWTWLAVIIVGVFLRANVTVKR